MRWKSHVRCGAGEKLEITSKVYLLLLIIELDLSGFNTSNVKYMGGMFNSCVSLEELDLDNFDTSNVEFMYEMFCDCKSLVNLKISNFNMDKVIDKERMFYNCHQNIKYLEEN